jgi:hypothetical protein
VANWAKGTYRTDGRATSRQKIKNPEYSQVEGRHELFERRRHLLGGHRVRTLHPELALV